MAVVLTANNAEKTLQKTVSEIPRNIVDDIILTDDGSQDNTRALAKKLNLYVVENARNRGYGGKKKTCYKTALRSGEDIVIMLKPDYKY